MARSAASQCPDRVFRGPPTHLRRPFSGQALVWARPSGQQNRNLIRSCHRPSPPPGPSIPACVPARSPQRPRKTHCWGGAEGPPWGWGGAPPQRALPLPPHAPLGPGRRRRGRSGPAGRGLQAESAWTRAGPGTRAGPRPREGASFPSFLTLSPPSAPSLPSGHIP